MSNPWISRKSCLYDSDVMVTYHTYSGLQDGMKNKWDPELISKTIGEYAVKQKIDTVSG